MASKNVRQQISSLSLLLLLLLDPGYRDPGSGMEKKIRIRDKHPGSATLPLKVVTNEN